MASTTYDHFEKTCKNGYPQYYGVTIDPVTGAEVKHEMNGSDWVAAGQAQGYESMALGCPHAGSFITIGGVPTVIYRHNGPIPKPRTPASLKNIVSIQGKRMGASKSVIEKVQSIVPYKNMMLMDIRNMGGHVADPNNVYEVVAEYGRLHPGMGTPTRDTRSYVTMVPKSGGGGGFDIGGIFGAISDLVDGISSSVNNANAQAFVNHFAQAFADYMTTDMGAIRATLNATQQNPGPWGGWGPRGALDMLIQYKNTSWAGLKHDITVFCDQHHMDIPPSVTALWQQQDMLEQELRNSIASGGSGGLNPNTQYHNQVPNAGSTSTSTGTDMGGGSGGGNSPMMSGAWFKKNLPWLIVALVVLIILIVVIAMASRKGKKSKSA